MYIATTAAEAAILANYISARQLYQLAKANLAPVQAAVHKQFRANSLAHNCNDLRDRLAAMDGAETVSAYARFNCTVRYDAASDEYIVVVLYG